MRPIDLVMPWLILEAILIVIFIVCLIFYIIWDSARTKGRMRGFIEERGVVVVDESSAGLKLAAMPKDPVVRRVDLSLFTVGAGRYSRNYFRLQLHLTSDFGVDFELTPKTKASLGKVFEEGEGEIGVTGVDQYFWTEAALPKEVAVILKAPEVLDAVATVFEQRSAKDELHSVEVAGDRVEVVFLQKKQLVEPLYQLALALAHSLENHRRS